MQRVSILPHISDHDIVQIQVNTSAKIIFQKPRSISPYKMANWDGMKQALEAYHQDMLERGKYSSINAVQLWDDNHSTLTSLTNKFIPSKLSNLHWVNQKLKWIARQRDSVFQKDRKSGKPADRKIHQTFLSILPWGYSWCGLKWSYLQTQYKTKLFTLLKHSKQDSASVAPLRKHNSVHQDDPRKPLFLMNSSSLF